MCSSSEENPDENISIEKLTGGRGHLADHPAGGYDDLHRAGAARVAIFTSRPTTIAAGQVPHRRRAAAGDGADCARASPDDPFAHQGHERAGYCRAPRAAGRPFPRALQGPADRLPRLHHADGAWRKCRAPRAGQGVDEREVHEALARRGRLCGGGPGALPPLHQGAVRHGAGDRADGLGQDDDALCGAERDQERRRQDHHD